MSQPEVRELNPSFRTEIIGLDLTRPLDNVTVQYLRNVFDEHAARCCFAIPLLRIASGNTHCAKFCGDVIFPTMRKLSLARPFSSASTRPTGCPMCPRPSAHWCFTPMECGRTSPSRHCRSMRRRWNRRSHRRCLLALFVAGKPLPTNSKSSSRDSTRYEWADQKAFLNVAEHALAATSCRRCTTVPRSSYCPSQGVTLALAVQTPLISANHAKEIVGLSADESDALLDAVFDCLYSDANVYVHEWQRAPTWWCGTTFAIHHARRNVTREGPVRTLRKVGLPLPTSKALTEVRSYQIAQ